MTGPVSIERQKLLRLLLGGIVLLGIFYAWNGTLPHQLSAMPLFDISIDNTFWLFHYSGLADLLHRYPALVIILEVTALLAALLAFVRIRPVYVTALLFCVIVLSLYQQSYSCTLTKIGVLPAIVLFPFCLKDALYPTAMRFVRFYLVYLMVSAALFKVINGGLWQPGQMENILLLQHADLRLAETGTWHVQLAEWLTRLHLAGPAYILVFLMEFSFAGLLFTRRYDRLYAVLLLFFCAGIFSVMRINTAELCLLAIPFWSGFPKNR